jgi:hypothetical protein
MSARALVPSSTSSPRAFLVLAAFLCASCAPPLMKLPTGAGLAAGDAAEALREATRACRAVSSITAEIGVSGSVRGHRLRARLLAGLAAPASARLEAVAPFGQPVFIFVARDNDATLLLPRDGRVLEHGRPDAVLESVAGVPLDAADLRIALTGCAVAPRAGDAKQLGEDWRLVPDGSSDVYVHRDSPTAPWRIVAAVHRGSGVMSWRSEYRDFQTAGPAAGLPSTVRLTSIDRKQFDLRLALSQVELNAALDADVFRIQTSPGAEPITIDELKRSGPLSNTSSGR